MSLVCKRFRAVTTANNLTHHSLSLFTNSPGKPFNWMRYLLREGAHLTSKNTYAIEQTFGSFLQSN